MTTVGLGQACPLTIVAPFPWAICLLDRQSHPVLPSSPLHSACRARQTRPGGPVNLSGQMWGFGATACYGGTSVNCLCAKQLLSIPGSLQSVHSPLGLCVGANLNLTHWTWESLTISPFSPTIAASRNNHFVQCKAAWHTHTHTHAQIHGSQIVRLYYGYVWISI